MKMLKILGIIIIGTISLMACGGSANPTLAVPDVTSGPVPAIEIISGSSDTCKMTDDTQSTVLGFEVIYYDVGTDSYMVGVMTAPEVGEIGAVETPGEGRHGEAGWGIYPYAYDLPPNTLITLEISVYAGSDKNAPLTSTSSLTYDCSTGETTNSSFEKAGG